MSKRIYWQNLDLESCGYVESELSAECLKHDPSFEVGIEKQTYDLRVLEGFHLHLPRVRVLLTSEERQLMFDKALRLQHKMQIFTASYQNVGIDFDEHFASNMRTLREEVYKSMTKIINETVKRAKEIK